MRQNKPIARHRKRGTFYVKVKPGGDPSLSTVTTVAGSTYLVATDSIEHLRPEEVDEMLNCSKCNNPSARAIVVYDHEPPPVGEKDIRDVRIVRFCATHWMEVEELLPLPAA